MTATEIIRDLQSRGVELRAEGDRLRFRPKEAVTPDLIKILKQHKAEIIAAVAGDKLSGFGLCPGPEQCGGSYPVSGGLRIHPLMCSQDWLDWLDRWSPHGEDQIQ